MSDINVVGTVADPGYRLITIAQNAVIYRRLITESDFEALQLPRLTYLGHQEGGYVYLSRGGFHQTDRDLRLTWGAAKLMGVKIPNDCWRYQRGKYYFQLHKTGTQGELRQLNATVRIGSTYLYCWNPDEETLMIYTITGVNSAFIAGLRGDARTSQLWLGCGEGEARAFSRYYISNHLSHGVQISRIGSMRLSHAERSRQMLDCGVVLMLGHRPLTEHLEQETLYEFALLSHNAMVCYAFTGTQEKGKIEMGIYDIRMRQRILEIKIISVWNCIRMVEEGMRLTERATYEEEETVFELLNSHEERVHLLESNGRTRGMTDNRFWPDVSVYLINLPTGEFLTHNVAKVGDCIYILGPGGARYAYSAKSLQTQRLDLAPNNQPHTQLLIDV